MATDKEIQSENRLVTIEQEMKALRATMQDVRADAADIKEDVAQVKLTFAKAGGVLLGFTMIGAFFGYVLTQVDKLKSIFN
jgi:flagellar motor component MotA